MPEVQLRLNPTPLAARAGMIVAICLAILSGCDDKQAPAAKAAPPAPVSVAQVQRQDVPMRVQAIGTVQAYTTVTIRPQIAAQVSKVAFSEGQELKKGDLLFVLDRATFQAILEAMQANLERDQALAADAKSDLERITEIYKAGAAKERELSASTANAAARAAQVKADQAAVESAKVNLAFTEIRSPIDGRSGEVMVNQGNIVKANETAMVVLNQVTPISVQFAVPERYLGQVQAAMARGEMAVSVAIPGSEEPETGTLEFIDNQVDRTTGMIGLKGTFANTNHRLWPGQFVNAALTLDTRAGALVVPSAAVQASQNGQIVFVVKADKTVEMRPVGVTSISDTLTVVDQGLAEGETVVTEGQLRLVPGARVQLAGGPASQPATEPKPALAAGAEVKR